MNKTKNNNDVDNDFDGETESNSDDDTDQIKSQPEESKSTKKHGNNKQHQFGPIVTLLRDNGIYVDEFTKKNTGYDNGLLYFLTQSHLDHRKSSLQRFTPTIYCSFITRKLIQAPHVIVLLPNRWYTLKGIEVYVAETLHCPGSFMFYFKKLQILHMGDTRVNLKILNIVKELKPKSILYDNLFSEFKGFVPSIESSAAMLHSTLIELSQQKSQIYFCLCHTGTLLLLQILGQKIKIDEQKKKEYGLKPDVLFLLEELNLVDSNSNIIGVGLKYKNIDIIVSSQYFVVNNINPNQIVHDKVNDKDIIRIFVSFHSCTNDLHLLRDYTLEPLHYE